MNDEADLVTSRDRARDLADLARELLRAPGEVPTADTVTDRALELVSAADWASLVVRGRRDQLVTLSATSDEARELDELQYELSEGPAVEVAHDVEWYRSGDLAHDARWRAWGPRAVEVGARSVLSVRLLGPDRPIGVLNLYAASAGGFGERDDIDLAVLYATHASVALTSSREIAGLRDAIHSRHVIGLAQGMLVERFSLTVDQSFDLLRRLSNQLNSKVVDIATEIVETHRLPTVPGADEEPADPA